MTENKHKDQDNTSTSGNDEPVDAETFYRDHYNHYDPRETAMRETAIGDLAVKCPVTHSDAWDGYWVVNDYELAKSVYQDWETFSSTGHRHPAPKAEGQFAMPPIDYDPPVQLDFRRLLNPWLTPARVAEAEPQIRELVTELIDGFIEDGKCDFYDMFSRRFPARMLYRTVLNIDESEVDKVKDWTETVFGSDPTALEVPEAQANWNAWTIEMCKKRRSEPRRDDLLDAIVHATVAGRSITDQELIGCFQLVIAGGFGTTSDSLSNVMLRLAKDPDLQARLRGDPSQIPRVMDEFLRFDPPVTGLGRRCTRDTVLGGQELKENERVYVNFHAANRDPSEFAVEGEQCPNTLDVDRGRNRHLSFGIGVHRCVGSNVARQNMRVALEEILPRLGEFSLSPGEEAVRITNGSWGLKYLPLTFTPGARSTS